MAEMGELIEKTAHLARLSLTPEELSTFTHQLNDILGYVDALREVDVEGVEPLLCPVELEPALREDVVQASPMDTSGRPKVLQSAGETLHDGFKVPPIL